MKNALISFATAMGVLVLMLGWQAATYAQDAQIEASLLHLPNGTIVEPESFADYSPSIQGVSNNAYTLIMSHDGEVFEIDLSQNDLEEQLSEFSFY